MACFHPLSAWKRPTGEVVFHNKGDGKPMQVPCGQCIGCRLERSRQWAMRIVHEASLYSDNCFVTLTYDLENIPVDAGLRKSHFQKFMKRLRHEFQEKVKFYHCGEYGEKGNRPHYHAILFNCNFNDWVYLFDSPAGHQVYTSPTLERIWGHGFVTIGEVSFESAGYCARYCMKKVNGKKSEEIDPETGLKHYERFHSHTGEIVSVLPEYATMSRGGRFGRGIGHDWIKRYTADCYPKDFTTARVASASLCATNGLKNTSATMS